MSVSASTSSPAPRLERSQRDQGSFGNLSLLPRVCCITWRRTLLCLCRRSRGRVQFTSPSSPTLSSLCDGAGPGAPPWSFECVCGGSCGSRERGAFEHHYLQHLPLFPSSPSISTESLRALPCAPLHRTRLQPDKASGFFPSPLSQY